MPVPGVDVFLVDDQIAGDSLSTSDTLFLLSTSGPATPTRKTAADTGNATLDAYLRGYFLDGGRSVYIQGYAASAGALPDLAGALALLPPGPGQIGAPEIVTSTQQIALAVGAWNQGKVALLNGASGASDSAVTTLATAVIGGGDARGAAFFADWLTYNDPLTGDTISVPQSITVAALIARNDRVLRNPNLAAAGKRGQTAAVGVQDLRSDARRTTLADAQINTMRIVPGANGGLRNYGFRSLADLTDLPYWKSFAASRLIMVWRSMVAGIDEDFVFEQIDGQRILLDRYAGALKAQAKILYDQGALYGSSPELAYSVDTSDAVNPVDDLADGEIKATTRLKVSEFVEHVITTVIRRPLTAEL